MKITKQTYHDTSKDLETGSELMAIYHLAKKGFTDHQISDILRDIGWYPGIGVIHKARTMVNAENGAMKELNGFFSGLGL